MIFGNLIGRIAKACRFHCYFGKDAIACVLHSCSSDSLYNTNFERLLRSARGNGFYFGNGVICAYGKFLARWCGAQGAPDLFGT
ncbi:MAG: hypothetical protein ACJAXK_000113 [Yoonia sp.]